MDIQGQIQRAAKVASDWWAERWEKEESRESFRSELEKRIVEEFQKPESAFLRGRDEKYLFLSVDYDPKDLLLEVIQKIGIKCSGYFFSASGLLPNKHYTEVYLDRIEPKEGYGNITETIYLSEKYQ